MENDKKENKWFDKRLIQSVSNAEYAWRKTVDNSQVIKNLSTKNHVKKLPALDDSFDLIKSIITDDKKEMTENLLYKLPNT